MTKKFVNKLWVEGIFETVYVCDKCGEISFYWTDDLKKHPAETEEEFNKWYEDHVPFCKDNLRITKVD
jgi:hypothetical protein